MVKGLTIKHYPLKIPWGNDLFLFEIELVTQHDFKSAAGDVKGVLDDLDKQFSKQHEGKAPTKEQKQQFEQKKKEIKEN